MFWARKSIKNKIFNGRGSLKGIKLSKMKEIEGFAIYLGDCNDKNIYLGA